MLCTHRWVLMLYTHSYRVLMLYTHHQRVLVPYVHRLRVVIGLCLLVVRTHRPWVLVLLGLRRPKRHVSLVLRIRLARSQPSVLMVPPGLRRLMLVANLELLLLSTSHLRDVVRTDVAVHTSAETDCPVTAFVGSSYRVVTVVTSLQYPSVAADIRDSCTSAQPGRVIAI